MKKEMKLYLYAFAIGMVLSAGIQATKYIIPDPERRIVVCLWDEIDGIEICRDLADIKESSKEREPETETKGVEL